MCKSTNKSYKEDIQKNAFFRKVPAYFENPDFDLRGIV